MAQEEKKLLLVDLSARLPYGVICEYSRHGSSRITEIDIVEETVYCDDFDEYVIIENIKPYLRPMSSMTDKEKEEFQAFHCVYEMHPDFQPMMCNLANELNMFNWLNKKMFDYRGLIEKGLTLEAPEGMYKIN